MFGLSNRHSAERKPCTYRVKKKSLSLRRHWCSFSFSWKKYPLKPRLYNIDHIETVLSTCHATGGGLLFLVHQNYGYADFISIFTCLFLVYYVCPFSPHLRSSLAQRTEAWWSHFRRLRAEWWINFFLGLGRHWGFNKDNELHV